jgi:hypothetical protein
MTMGLTVVVLLGLSMLPPLVESWTGPVEPPHLHADGLSWRMRHGRAGAPLAFVLWWALSALIGGPLFSLVVYSPDRAPGLLQLLVLVLTLALALGVLSWAFLLQVQTRSELKASADGLVWTRCWPLRSRRWAWRELRRVLALEEALVMETAAGEQLCLLLPGVASHDLHAVVSVLEATRAAPPPEAEPVPEVPQALRQMQRSAT